MTDDSIGLFVHVTAALALFMGIAVSRLALGGIRTADETARLQLWLGVARRTSVVFPASLAALLASGMYLTAQSWSFSTPWVATSIVGVVVLGAAGALVTGRHGRQVGQALGAAQGRLTPDVVERQRSSGPFLVGVALNGVALGIVFLMTTKPGWPGSVLALLVGAAAGALLGVLLLRRPAPRPAPEGAAH